MYKEVKYNQPFKKRERKSAYHQECQLLHDFHGGDKRNMRLEYANYNEAKNARAAMIRYVGQTRTPLVISQRGNFVFVHRKDGADNEIR